MRPRLQEAVSQAPPLWGCDPGRGGRGSPLLTWPGAGGTGLVLWAVFSRVPQLVRLFIGGFCPHPCVSGS